MKSEREREIEIILMRAKSEIKWVAVADIFSLVEMKKFALHINNSNHAEHVRLFEQT